MSHDSTAPSLEVARTPVRADARGARRLAFVAFALAHIPLALIVRHNPPWVTTVHALGTLLVGVVIAMTTQRAERAVHVAAYIIGCEVLWRMSITGVPWEFGKYAVILVLGVAAIRLRRRRRDTRPALYFALLVPSAILTIEALPWEQVRAVLSANVAGPLALAVSAWFFTRLENDFEQLERILLILMVPILGLAAVVLFGTIRSDSIVFGMGSNAAASAGFGPNQVSSMLGLGSLLAFLLLLGAKASRVTKSVWLLLVIAFAALSALTFSRGGLYSATLGALAASIAMVGGRGRVRILMLLLTVVAAGRFLAVPRLEALTDGAVRRRFQDTKLSGREEIIEHELRVFVASPILGVGPGRGPMAAVTEDRDMAPHTEFTRMLAEHGIPGLVAILVLISMMVSNVKRAQPGSARATVLALTLWGVAFMLHSATRLAAPAFMIGIGCAVLSGRRARPKTS